MAGVSPKIIIEIKVLKSADPRMMSERFIKLEKQFLGEKLVSFLLFDLRSSHSPTVLSLFKPTFARNIHH